MKKILILAALCCLACTLADQTTPTADSTLATADQLCFPATFTITADGSPVATNAALIPKYDVQFFRLKIEPAAILTQATTNLSGTWNTIQTNNFHAGTNYVIRLL